MLGDQWYPIKVDRVNKNSICNDSNVQFKDDACTKIGLENGITGPPSTLLSVAGLASPKLLFEVDFVAAVKV
jgi:hypothetical protein